MVAGLLLWTAFPALGWWPAAPLGVGLLALATAGARPGQGFVLGLLAGYTYFGPLLWWSGVYVGRFPWFALTTLEALYVGLIGLVCALLQRDRILPRTPRERAAVGPPSPVGALAPVRPLLVALVWVAGEWARGHTPFGGFPWGRLAFSQADAPFARVAALAGAPGVTFAVALAGSCLAACAVLVATRMHAIRYVVRPLPWRPARLRTSLLALGAGSAAVALLAAPLAVPVPTGVGDGTPTGLVTAIQGNVPQAGLDFNAQRRAVLDNHAAVTREAARSLQVTGAPRPDLVIWPENASDIDPLRNVDAARVIETAVAAIGAPVIVGAVLSEPVDRVSNTSLLYVPGKGVVARYTKLRPVPFAEYIPYRPFFRMFSDKVDLVVRDFVAGDHVGLFRVPRAGGGDIAVGLNICFEVAVDDVVRDSVRQGADLIAVQTNNATFGMTDESVQQLAISRLRAIEHGRSVVHISNVGVSALITPDGTPHQETALFTSAVLAGELPLRTQPTLATRVGSRPEWIACFVVLILVSVRLFGARGARLRATPAHPAGGPRPESTRGPHPESPGPSAQADDRPAEGIQGSVPDSAPAQTAPPADGAATEPPPGSDRAAQGAR